MTSTCFFFECLEAISWTVSRTGLGFLGTFWPEAVLVVFEDVVPVEMDHYMAMNNLFYGSLQTMDVRYTGR